MPLPVDNLTPDSGLQAIRDAISATIRYLMEKEGKSQKDAAGQAYAMARDKTGKPLGEGTAR